MADKQTTPMVARLLTFVDEANDIARNAFALGNNELGVEAISIASQYLQAAKVMQRLHDVSTEA